VAAALLDEAWVPYLRFPGGLHRPRVQPITSAASTADGGSAVYRA